MAESSEKPKVIILGGCGFIGRNMVSYLISNDLASLVRVVDKVPPQTAWLSKRHQVCFDDKRVEFRSANLIIPGSCENAFGDETFDYAINCACETRLGQTVAIYREGILKVGANCAENAAKQRVKRYIEISSGQMFSSEKVRHKESDKVDPWTSIAKCKWQVEQHLHTIPGLNFTIVRPAIVYGIGDRNGIAPRLVLGAIYKHLGESMRLLWSRDLVMNTVHVDDLCHGIWYLAQREDTLSETYNIADCGHTTQGVITDIISEIFNINHDYCGNALSKVAKVDLSSVVEDVNDKHLGPWAETCSLNGVENTPLSPYIHQELLDNKHLNLDTSKLMATGFTFTVPTLKKQALLEF
ncbi:uncharacterized protein LOC142329952 isoform X2 [Lycorma delicatula]|uniref:uncharacterized protein LOC142329952 isoform X2 n=1 Tax=Lycorma delicatula TaxID=130591 RepID=UPI003F50F895